MTRRDQILHYVINAIADPDRLTEMVDALGELMIPTNTRPEEVEAVIEPYEKLGQELIAKDEHDDNEEELGQAIYYWIRHKGSLDCDTPEWTIKEFRRLGLIKDALGL